MLPCVIQPNAVEAQAPADIEFSALMESPRVVENVPAQESASCHPRQYHRRRRVCGHRLLHGVWPAWQVRLIQRHIRELSWMGRGVYGKALYRGARAYGRGRSALKRRVARRAHECVGFVPPRFVRTTDDRWPQVCRLSNRRSSLQLRKFNFRLCSVLCGMALG